MERSFAPNCDSNCPNYGILCEVAKDLEHLEWDVEEDRTSSLEVVEPGRVGCTGSSTEPIPMSGLGIGVEPRRVCGAEEPRMPRIAKVVLESERYKASIEAQISGPEVKLFGTVYYPKGRRAERLMPRL